MNNPTPVAHTGLLRRLSPQCQVVLDHLRRAGSITQVEANAVHRIRALPRRIADLKAAGVAVTAQQRRDLTGQRYVRYFLRNAAPTT
jgi:hypothetical protein